MVENPEGWLYHTDGKTCWVRTSVTIGAETQYEILPVMDMRNKSIPLESITSTDVSKAIKRCLVKNLALFGLDLNLWNGEEIGDEAQRANDEKLSDILDEILRTMEEKIKEGADKNGLYNIVSGITGKKNPRAIKDIKTAQDVLSAMKNAKKEDVK